MRSRIARLLLLLCICCSSVLLGISTPRRVLDLAGPAAGEATALGIVGPELLFAVTNETASERTLFRVALDGHGAEPFFTLPVRRGDHAAPNGAPTLRTAGGAWYFVDAPVYREHGEESARQIWRFDPASQDRRALFDDPEASGEGALSDELLWSAGELVVLASGGASPHPFIDRLRPRSGAIAPLLELHAGRVRSLGEQNGVWVLLEDEQRVVAFDLATRTLRTVAEFAGATSLQARRFAGGIVWSVGWSAPDAAPRFELWQYSGGDPSARRLAAWSADGACQPAPVLPPEGEVAPALFGVEPFDCQGELTELWITDGSAERTRLLRTMAAQEIVTLADGSRLLGELPFLAVTFDTGTSNFTYELWRSDGSGAGTRKIADLPSAAGANASDWRHGAIGDGGEAVYFPWFDGAHGRELWRSDGSAAGTGILADLAPGPGGSIPRGLVSVGDQVLFAAKGPASGIDLWQVAGGTAEPMPVGNFGAAATGSDIAPLLVAGGSFFFAATDEEGGRALWIVDGPSVAPCVASEATHCLANGRFRVRAERRDFAGLLGRGQATLLTADSAAFWFFDSAAPDLLFKIVDACDLPGFENFWFYATGLTNVEARLDVVDTRSGERHMVATALGEPFPPTFDSGSFHACETVTQERFPSTPVAPLAGATGTALELLDGRFEVAAAWRRSDGSGGAGVAVPVSDASGYFWFFDPANVELLVKMTDACGVPDFDNFWLFASGLTDVEVTLTVSDHLSGESLVRTSEQGSPFLPVLETGSLHLCP
ncbi:MAG: hypothetical protein AB7G12_03410 [Thermoanaerobaculia bacterium]